MAAHSEKEISWRYSIHCVGATEQAVTSSGKKVGHKSQHPNLANRAILSLLIPFEIACVTGYLIRWFCSHTHVGISESSVITKRCRQKKCAWLDNWRNKKEVFLFLGLETTNVLSRRRQKANSTKKILHPRNREKLIAIISNQCSFSFAGTFHLLIGKQRIEVFSFSIKRCCLPLLCTNKCTIKLSRALIASA